VHARRLTQPPNLHACWPQLAALASGPSPSWRSAITWQQNQLRSAPSPHSPMQCQEKTTQCLSCDGRTGSCTACNDGYGVSNGACAPCAPTCAVCSKNAAKCEYCAVGGVDAATGKCVRCKQAGCTAVGCKRDASKCTACRVGWRLKGTTCVKK